MAGKDGAEQSQLADLLRDAAARPDKLHFVHYSCSLTVGDPAEKEVGFICVLRGSGPSVTFDAWRDGEEAALRQFADFVNKNSDRVWLGWRFLRSDYGFAHISVRARCLAGLEIVVPAQTLDVKDLLKRNFGQEFADHPRLEGAARLNNVTTTGLLTAERAAQAYKAKNWPAMRVNIERRAAIIQDLFWLAARGEFVPKTQPDPIDSTLSLTKRSTERGEGRAKLIAALTKRHEYANDGDGQSTASGYLGGVALANALGIPATRRNAFAQNLMRQRKILVDDCWHEVRDPQPNSPRYLYRVDSPQLRDLAAEYRTPKPT